MVHGSFTLRALSVFHRQRPFVKFLDVFEKAWLPFWPSSQEKYLKDAFTPSKLTVVTGPRGCRMTQTALRLVYRRPFLYNFKYINSDHWQALARKHEGEPLTAIREKTFREGLNDLMFSFASTTLVACLSGIVMWQSKGKAEHDETQAEGQRTNTSNESLFQNVLHRVHANLPSQEAALCGILYFMAVFVFRLRRQTRFIFDDVRVGTQMVNTNKVESARLGLEWLRAFGEKYPTILISSNEGLPECFQDRATLKYDVIDMMLATPFELVSAMYRARARRHKQELDTGVDVILNLLETEFQWNADALFSEKLSPRLPSRWAFSVRFWNQFTEVEAKELIAKDSVVDFQTLAKIAMMLDLEAEGIFKIAALGCSKPCSEEDRNKLLKLTFTDPRAHAHALPKDAPFRLCVAHLLVYQLEQKMVHVDASGAQTTLRMLHKRLRLPDRDMLDDGLEIIWTLKMRGLFNRVAVLMEELED